MLETQRLDTGDKNMDSLETEHSMEETMLDSGDSLTDWTETDCTQSVDEDKHIHEMVEESTDCSKLTQAQKSASQSALF